METGRWSRDATRYDQLADRFLGMLLLVSAR